MGRHASTYTPPVDELPPDSEAMMTRAIEARQDYDIKRMVATRFAKHSPAIMAVGRIQMAEFFRAVSETSIAQTFAEIRRSKEYLGMPYTDAEGQQREVEDLEQFCRIFLGRSYDRCRELADNLHQLGPELYEQAQAVGFKSRDYRALKALPADDQAAVKQALEEGDKDNALTVLSQLVARHQDARETAERQRDKASKAEAETKANYEAATAILGERETEIRRLKGGEIPVPTVDVQIANWTPAAYYLIGELNKHIAQVEALIQGAAQLEIPTDPAEHDAWRKALLLVDDALRPGLHYLGEKLRGCEQDLEFHVTSMVYAPAPGAEGGGGGGASQTQRG